MKNNVFFPSPDSPGGFYTNGAMGDWDSSLLALCKARAWEETQEASEAYLWRHDALSFEPRL